jgi:hypothetical protein
MKFNIKMYDNGYDGYNFQMIQKKIRTRRLYIIYIYIIHLERERREMKKHVGQMLATGSSG